MIPTSFHHRNIISSFHCINYFPIHSTKNRLSAKKQLTKHLQANQWSTDTMSHEQQKVDLYPHKQALIVPSLQD